MLRKNRIDENHVYKVEPYMGNIFKITRYSTEIICSKENKNFYYSRLPKDDEVVNEDYVLTNKYGCIDNEKYCDSFSRKVNLATTENIPVLIFGWCTDDGVTFFDTNYDNEYLYGEYPEGNMTKAILIVVIGILLFALIMKCIPF